MKLAASKIPSFLLSLKLSKIIPGNLINHLDENWRGRQEEISLLKSKLKRMKKQLDKNNLTRSKVITLDPGVHANRGTVREIQDFRLVFQVFA